MCKTFRKITRKKRKGGGNFIFLYERYRALQLTGFAQYIHTRTSLSIKIGLFLSICIQKLHRLAQ